MDVTSLYTNIRQEEGITLVCQTYENFHDKNPPTATHFLREMLSLILKENSFDFNVRKYLPIHGTAINFATIFMGKVEKEFLRQNTKKPLVSFRSFRKHRRGWRARKKNK